MRSFVNEAEYLKYSRGHFIQRLLERYQMVLSEQEYEDLNKLPNRQMQNIWRGYFTTTYGKSFGILKLKGEDVVCVYSKEHGLFQTALPKEIMTNVDTAIEYCFRSIEKPVAYLILGKIKEELQKECRSFDSIKDAAIYYYANSDYPSLLIECFKHGRMSTFMICNQIKKIMEGTHKKVRLTLEKISAPAAIV